MTNIMICKSWITSVLMVFCIPACNSLESQSVVPVDSATLTVKFHNDSSTEVRWTIEDENTEETVFLDHLFAPGEVKSASIATSSSRRYGAVRFRESEPDVWQRDSLITNDQTVEMKPVSAL